MIIYGMAYPSTKVHVLLLGVGGSHDDNIHPANFVYLVVRDFREDQLLFETEGVIATAVKSFRRNTAEIAYTR